MLYVSASGDVAKGLVYMFQQQQQRICGVYEAFSCMYQYEYLVLCEKTKIAKYCEYFVYILNHIIYSYHL